MKKNCERTRRYFLWRQFFHRKKVGKIAIETRCEIAVKTLPPKGLEIRQIEGDFSNLKEAKNQVENQREFGRETELATVGKPPKKIAESGVKNEV